MPHHRFVYSCVNYGITTWGMADQSKKHKIEVKMNSLVRTILGIKKFSCFSSISKFKPFKVK